MLALPVVGGVRLSDVIDREGGNVFNMLLFSGFNFQFEQMFLVEVILFEETFHRFSHERIQRVFYK